MTNSQKFTVSPLKYKVSREDRYRWIQPHTTFDYLLPRENKMYDLKFRIVQFKISDTTHETLFTKLPANKFPAKVLKELYKMLWGIETSFKE